MSDKKVGQIVYMKALKTRVYLNYVMSGKGESQDER